MSSPDQVLDIDKDILDGFIEESTLLLKELTGIAEQLEMPAETFPAKLLEDYSQIIDRIMGAAKTLLLLAPDHIGLQSIGKISEICKSMGYKAAERNEAAVIPLFAAFWMDVIEVLQELLEVIQDRDETIRIAKSFSPILQKRLEWLLSKVNSGSQGQRVATAEGAELKEGEQLSAADFANLLKELGIK